MTIAGISTRELVAKDYATELNDEKVRRAGHFMAQKLAGSLALVTCKEPLKSNLGGHIRHYLTEYGFNEVCDACPSSPADIDFSLSIVANGSRSGFHRTRSRQLGPCLPSR